MKERERERERESESMFYFNNLAWNACFCRQAMIDFIHFPGGCTCTHQEFMRFQLRTLE